MSGFASLVVGIDVGTSGARAVVMDGAFEVVAQASSRMADHGSNMRDPAVWWRAVEAALDTVLSRIPRDRIVALAVDGTSGTMLAIDRAGKPISDALMYSDAVEDQAIRSAIAIAAPASSAAHGPTSGLAKLIALQSNLEPWKIIHQADWIAGQFSARFDVSDENNALKTGYDPVARQWPGWIGATGARAALMPDVVAAGTPVGVICKGARDRFHLGEKAIVVAGTTDGCASFLATGASEIGDGVTALGSSLTVKVLSQEPIFAAQYGLYSHRLGNLWLAGGASNTGGRVLSQLFSDRQLVELSARIDPDTPTGFDYYPLPGEGERFPTADPSIKPRMDPRPSDDAVFLQAIFEGIASIERLGYARLSELGGPRLKSLRSVGGGAANRAWTTIRKNLLAVPFLPSASEEAAAGTARLALAGARASGLA